MLYLLWFIVGIIIGAWFFSDGDDNDGGYR